jgi:predicted alpha-1,2-mannosidase
MINRIKLPAVLVLLAGWFSISCNPQVKSMEAKEEPLARYVDPYIGTGFHGHVFLGANVPFGAVQLGPVNISEGWDWCSGYHYSDSTIYGFAHTHLSGTGIGDLGDINLMPVVGDVKLAKGQAGDPNSGYYSLFDHKNETVEPGYYSVLLQRYNVQVRLTATERTGLHEYRFPASENAKVIIDLESGIGWDQPVESFAEQLNDTTIRGYRYSKGWAQDQRIFFTAVFSKPMKSFQLYDSTVMQNGKKYTGRKQRALASFSTTKDERVMVKVAISPVSIENAAANMKAEIPGWNFEAVRARAMQLWNNELGKIRISTSDTSVLRCFYTAIYHTMVAPSIFNDHNGDYRGTDKKVYPAAGFTNLTTFSLWDTYRAAHPLYTLTQPERVNDMVNSMLAIYQQQGKLPVWHLMGNETNTMPGYSAVQVIADAYLKGFRGFDTALAWEAVKTTAMLDERGMNYIKKYGYIPADSLVESVAIGLEYSIADGAIARMAKQLNKNDDYAYFQKRSQNYRNYYDAVSGFMRGRLNQNIWRTPFSPFESRHMKDDFTEGNAWQYTWLVPQDVYGLIQLLGGKERFIKKLDSLFVIKGDMGKEASNDISGLIGSYAHGNEPSHHISYLYAFAGQSWKTADKVRQIMSELYTDKPDGLSGNEDVGQMSSWYILSVLGLYQVNPFNGVFIFGSPLVDKAELKVGNGKTLKLAVKNNSKANRYIQSISWNGKNYSRPYILYSDLMSGGSLELEMGPKPSITWGLDGSLIPE